MTLCNKKIRPWQYAPLQDVYKPDPKVFFRTISPFRESFARFTKKRFHFKLELLAEKWLRCKGARIVMAAGTFPKASHATTAGSAVLIVK